MPTPLARARKRRELVNAAPDRAVRNSPRPSTLLPRSSARHSPQLHRPGEAAISGSAPTAGVVRRGARRAAPTRDKERGRLSFPRRIAAHPLPTQHLAALVQRSVPLLRYLEKVTPSALARPVRANKACRAATMTEN